VLLGLTHYFGNFMRDVAVRGARSCSHTSKLNDPMNTVELTTTPSKLPWLNAADTEAMAKNRATTSKSDVRLFRLNEAPQLRQEALAPCVESERCCSVGSRATQLGQVDRLRCHIRVA
jgi:hypothetical protein